MKIELNKEALELIRFKCTNRQTDFNATELKALEEVYYQITKVSTGRTKGLVLDKSCSLCIQGAMNIVYNYITFHEEKVPEAIQPRPKAKITITKVEEDYTDYTTMSYQELKKLAAKNGYQGATPKKDDLLKFLNKVK